MKNKPTVVLLGAGNAGGHLAKALSHPDLNLLQVWSRHNATARAVAEPLGVPYCSDYSRLKKEADLYILSVKDDAIGEVSRQLSKVIFQQPLVVHTSGAVSSAVLSRYFPRYGVFYPLQTFTKNKAVNFHEVPVCLTAGNEQDYRFLAEIASIITTKVSMITDEQRAALHLAAVFVNNFTNHLFLLAEEFLKEKDLTLDLLQPLMSETLKKAMADSPFEMQTGPARRGDEGTMQKHLSLLKDFPVYQDIYRLLSKSIQYAYSR